MSHSESHPSLPAPPRRFACTVPGCKKLFLRKEHLTRHSKSHETGRYARSDVLNRHVEFHPRYYLRSKHNFVACVQCRGSKIECDEDSPCSSCRHKSLPCVRRESGPDPDPDPKEGSSLILSPQESKFRPFILRRLASDNKYMDLYFDEIHSIWPILDAPLKEGTPDLLIAAIMLLGSWVKEDADHLELFPLLFDEINEMQRDPSLSIPVIQATVLCLIYMTFCLSTEGMAIKALKLHSSLVTACRFSGILLTQREMWYISSAIFTVEQDQLYRIAFATLRLDAYLTALTDFPPLIRYQELSMPLSQSTYWAPASNDQERRKILEDEPTMRQRTSFRFLVHDLLGTPRPNALAPPWAGIDYHFVLCALQSNIWEAGHEALRTAPDKLHARTEALDLRKTWLGHLQTWIHHLEEDCLVTPRKEDFTLPQPEPLSPSLSVSAQTLHLYHISALKMYSPADIWALNARYYKLQPQAVGPPQPRSNTYPGPWHMCKLARHAIYHSAQITRLSNSTLPSSSSSYSSLCINPLAKPALLMAAMFVVGSTYHARVCPVCIGSVEDVQLVNVFDAPHGCKRLSRWLDKGVGVVDWGNNVFVDLPLCMCHRDRLVDWFRALLVGDKVAEDAFALFVEQLETG